MFSLYLGILTRLTIDKRAIPIGYIYTYIDIFKYVCVYIYVYINIIMFTIYYYYYDNIWSNFKLISCAEIAKKFIQLASRR